MHLVSSEAPRVRYSSSIHYRLHNPTTVALQTTPAMSTRAASSPDSLSLPLVRFSPVPLVPNVDDIMQPALVRCETTPSVESSPPLTPSVDFLGRPFEDWDNSKTLPNSPSTPIVAKDVGNTREVPARAENQDAMPTWANTVVAAQLRALQHGQQCGPFEAFYVPTDAEQAADEQAIDAKLARLSERKASERRGAQLAAEIMSCSSSFC